MFGWLFGKKEVERVKEETKKSFEEVKKDISHVGDWIKHLDSEKSWQKKEMESLREDLSSVKESVEGIKNIISFIGEMKMDSNFKTPRRLSKQQTAVQVVQTAVQTAVQAPKLDHFSTTERAILWVLLNTDMKLSYEDIGAVLGKEKSTIRSQLSIIKQKNDGLVEEIIEKNGKKRVFIPEDMKEKLLKKSKVRVNISKKSKKSVKN